LHLPHVTSFGWRPALNQERREHKPRRPKARNRVPFHLSRLRSSQIADAAHLCCEPASVGVIGGFTVILSRARWRPCLFFSATDRCLIAGASCVNTHFFPTSRSRRHTAAQRRRPRYCVACHHIRFCALFHHGRALRLAIRELKHPRGRRVLMGCLVAVLWPYAKIYCQCASQKAVLRSNTPAACSANTTLKCCGDRAAQGLYGCDQSEASA
jgi:hypothetical protein